MSSVISTSEPGEQPLPPGLAEELAEAWRSLPVKVLFFGLLGCWILLFHLFGNATFGYVNSPSLFGWLNYAYSMSQDDELGRYIPLIVLALCWWKRDELIAVPKAPALAPVVLVLLALAIHILGFAIQQTRLSVVAFYLGLYGLLGVAWGWRFQKSVFFPCFLFVFCVPLGTVAETITVPLRMIATSVTAWISQVGLGIALIQKGNLILDPENNFRYEVAAACGGLRSLTATLALASIYAFITVGAPWKRLVMIASAFPLAIAGNVLRLTLIIVAAEAFGQEAGQWVHDNSIMSLLPYVPAFLGLGALGSRLRDKPDPAPPAIPIPQT